ncbi:MAG: hypothetical protein ACYCXW_20495 [Solirubrobacteraceae bacterium]
MSAPRATNRDLDELIDEITVDCADPQTTRLVAAYRRWIRA